MANHSKLLKTDCDDAGREVRLTQEAMDEVGEERGLWYESPAEIASHLRRGKLRAARLTWALRQMERRLDVHERYCLELHYLEGRSFREVAIEIGVKRAVAMRIIRGAIAKLRKAAAISGPDETPDDEG